jgi:hypothetical protein
MLPREHFFLVGKETKADTREFLDKVLQAILNILNRKGMNTKDVEILGTNDIHVFRGTNIVVFSFSRSSYLLHPRFCEFSLSEVISKENSISLNQASYFTSTGFADYLKNELKCVSPVSVAFPISYLSLKDKELEEAHMKVAELMVRPAEEDIDQKKRIVRVNPIYRGRDFLIERDLCFVLMEFQQPYTDIYDHLIKPTVEGEGFRCLKSDDIFTTTSVIEDIWANINKAALIIAEISSSNPNVMYELGICHTVGKNVMMITQHPDKIPFNFRHMRCYPYTNDIPGSDELKKNIKSVIQHMKATQEVE